jgi:hypothetical protein
VGETNTSANLPPSLAVHFLWIMVTLHVLVHMLVPRVGGSGTRQGALGCTALHTAPLHTPAALSLASSTLASPTPTSTSTSTLPAITALTRSEAPCPVVRLAALGHRRLGH